MTEILAWLNPTRWLILFALLGGLGVGYLVWSAHEQGIGEARANARWQAATTQQKALAAAMLASETERVHAAEVALQNIKNRQELSDANHQKTVSDLGLRLRAAVYKPGGLRDPNAAGCRPGGDRPGSDAATATADRAGDAPEAGGVVSEPLSRLLLDITASADAINIAYTSCRADAYAVRGLPSAPDPPE